MGHRCRVPWIVHQCWTRIPWIGRTTRRSLSSCSGAPHSVAGVESRSWFERGSVRWQTTKQRVLLKLIPPHVKMWCFLKLFSTKYYRISFNIHSCIAFARIYITGVNFVERTCERGARFKYWCWISVQLKGVACDDIKSLSPGSMLSWMIWLDKPSLSQQWWWDWEVMISSCSLWSFTTASNYRCIYCSRFWRSSTCCIWWESTAIIEDTLHLICLGPGHAIISELLKGGGGVLWTAEGVCRWWFCYRSGITGWCESGFIFWL